AASPTASASTSPTAASAAASPTAQAPGVTLDDCYQAALKRSQTQAISFESITQAEEHYKQATGSVLPNVSLIGQLYTQSSGVANIVPAAQNQYRINATQPLFQGMREYAALRETKDLLASSKQAYRWAAWQLYADTSAAFNQVLAAEKDLSDLKSELGLYGDRISFLQGWLNIGRAQDTDVLSVQSAQAQIKAQLEAAKYLVAASREVLTFLTGMPVDQPLADVETLPAEVEPMDRYTDGLDQRPDLLAAAANVLAAKEGVTIESGQHLPQVSVGADYYPYRYAPDTDINWDAYLNVTMPIFMGGIINSQTRAAESAQRQAEEQMEQTRRMDLENLRSAYVKLHYDLSQEQALVDAADLAGKNYKAETRNFERGLVTNLDVLQAMVTFVTTLQAADATHYAALGDYQSLQAQTGRAPGLPDSSDAK
ncbi:MAG TPA: TolC family protein, partial [bacterium]|nr:TolC family protein [bacterium]